MFQPFDRTEKQSAVLLVNLLICSFTNSLISNAPQSIRRFCVCESPLIDSVGDSKQTNEPTRRVIIDNGIDIPTRFYSKNKNLKVAKTIENLKFIGQRGNNGISQSQRSILNIRLNDLERHYSAWYSTARRGTAGSGSSSKFSIFLFWCFFLNFVSRSISLKLWWASPINGIVPSE